VLIAGLMKISQLSQDRELYLFSPVLRILRPDDPGGSELSPCVVQNC